MEVKKEKIELCNIYKEDGQIKIRYSKSAQQFEIYGFLKVYLKIMEEDMLNEFEPPDEGEEWEMY